MATFRYSISNGLSGCYMPDHVSGPYIGRTRKELAALIADQLALHDWPKSAIREIKLRKLWAFIKRNGSSSAHFSISRNGYEIAFHGLTEEEAGAMELEQF